MTATTPTPYEQGHTPHDRLAFLINSLCDELALAPSATSTRAVTLAQQAKAVIGGFDAYVARMSSPHPRIVDTMIAEGNARDWEQIHREGKTQFRLIPEMTAGPYEAVVLRQLAMLSKAKTILEIGMFTGTTTISLAMIPGVERIVTLELERYLESNNRPYFEQSGVANKIDIRIGDASTLLDELVAQKASFDMVFIDADKGNYVNYFRKIMDGNLLSKGGFIAADNVAYKAAPWAPDACYEMGHLLDAFNQAVREYPGVDVVMLPVEDGISLIRKKDE